MGKPPLAFFESLGQYVYEYIEPETRKPYYTGKGRLDRCWAHVVEKGFDPDHCFIVAKNLEKFEDKKDWQSFLLESYLINLHEPQSNSVSGHYKECFVMASLSSLFTEFESEQHDNFEKLPDWYIDNYDAFRNRLREIRINSTATFMLSAVNRQLYCSFTWYPTSPDDIRMSFEVAPLSDKEKLESYKKNLVKWLKSEGYTATPEGSGDVGNRKFSVAVSSIDDIIGLWRNFWS